MTEWGGKTGMLAMGKVEKTHRENVQGQIEKRKTTPKKKKKMRGRERKPKSILNNLLCMLSFCAKIKDCQCIKSELQALIILTEQVSQCTPTPIPHPDLPIPQPPILLWPFPFKIGSSSSSDTILDSPNGG